MTAASTTLAEITDEELRAAAAWVVAEERKPPADRWYHQDPTPNPRRRTMSDFWLGFASAAGIVAVAALLAWWWRTQGRWINWPTRFIPPPRIGRWQVWGVTAWFEVRRTERKVHV